MFDFLDITSLLYRAPALLIALTLHEYAHAFVSDRLGDPTPSMEGRLTVNPLAHLDPVGTVMLVLCGFGWAKPVEIDPRYYVDYKSGVIKVSFAGPGMNLLICFIAVLLMTAGIHFRLLQQSGYMFLYWIMLYNVWFAFFNLIPVPPLDGSKILEMILPGELAWNFHNISYRYGFIILMLLVFSGMVNRFIGPLANSYVEICSMIGKMIF